MKLFDTHSHLNFKAFEEDFAAVIDRARQSGVEMLILGTDLKTSCRAIELARHYSGVYAGVGFHPTHLQNRPWQKEVREILVLAKDKRVKAIGEVGFDNFRLSPSSLNFAKIQQEKILNQFLAAAFRLGKPLVFHSRGWLDELVGKIKENLSSVKRVGAVLHCYPGDMRLANWLAQQGLYLGFNGLVTKNHAWDQVIKEIPLKNILLETDAPFLTPAKQGKKRNEPRFVYEVAEYIAEIKKIKIERVAEATFKNARSFLQLS